MDNLESKDLLVVDTSEIKTFRHCRRQWAFNSRNKLHLRPTTTPKALNFGSIFHACLHAMYGNQPLEIEACRNRMDGEDFRILENVIGEYVSLVLPSDFARYEILAIEHRFTDPISGSVDMVVREKDTGNIYGMEHKSCKSFRSEIFNLLDEQPMTYTIAIKRAFGRCDGILLNEVKKLKTKLDQKRSKLVYTDEELDFFLQGMLADKEEIRKAKEGNVTQFTACPESVKCQMCDYQPLCLELRVHGDITKLDPQLLLTYGYEVRTQDHLSEEKEISLLLKPSAES